MLKFENKTNGRFYYLQQDRDLFNHFILRVIRGGTRNRHFSVIRIVASGSEDQVNAVAHQLSKIRLKRGYTLVNET